MSGAMDMGCDCICFDEGDWVESRLNPNIKGIVVGEADFGRFYNVQLAGSLEIKQFHGVTLRHSIEPDDLPPAYTAPVATDDDSNVIDFTKARDLRKNTTTRGAA